MHFRLLALLLAASPLCAKELVVTIDTHQITSDGIELIVAETNGTSFSTGKITKDGSQTWKWDVNPSKGEVYIYFNYFHGEADVSVSLQDTKVFSGFCEANTKDNSRLTDISKKPEIWISKDVPSMITAKDEPVSFLRFKQQTEQGAAANP
jgi:hypothetical protein